MMGNVAPLVAFGIALLMGWVCQKVAESKGYNGQMWGLAGLLVWPVALPVLLVKGRNPQRFRRCPDCGATDVPTDVPVCRHCGRDERKQIGVGPAI